MDLRDALTEAFELVLMDTTIESAKVCGNGPCFSAGGDLNEFGLATDLAMAHQVRQIRMPGHILASRQSVSNFGYMAHALVAELSSSIRWNHRGGRRLSVSVQRLALG